MSKLLFSAALVATLGLVVLPRLGTLATRWVLLASETTVPPAGATPSRSTEPVAGSPPSVSIARAMNRRFIRIAHWFSPRPAIVAGHGTKPASTSFYRT